MSLNQVIDHHSRFLMRAFEQLSYYLLPPYCILCGFATQRSFNLCQACEQDLPSLPQSCRQCGLFLNGVLREKPLCGACLTTPPPFDQTFALFPYETPIVSLMIALKFRQQLSHALAFGQLLAKQIEQKWYQNQPLPDVIVPVPLHSGRLKERGFNQAVEIARPIARRFSLGLDVDGLRRVRYTAAQSGLIAEERRRNMRGVFRAGRDYSGVTVALLDDVVTTGSTVTGCAEELKRRGVKQVHVWCCARRG